MADNLIAAIQEVLAVEQHPLEIWRIAEGAKLSEDLVLRRLFRSMRQDRTVIDFRYPPIPCAAVVAIRERK